jgi:hypothetical protein
MVTSASLFVVLCPLHAAELEGLSRAPLEVRILRVAELYARSRAGIGPSQMFEALGVTCDLGFDGLAYCAADVGDDKGTKLEIHQIAHPTAPKKVFRFVIHGPRAGCLDPLAVTGGVLPGTRPRPPVVSHGGDGLLRLGGSMAAWIYADAPRDVLYTISIENRNALPTAAACVSRVILQTY